MNPASSGAERVFRPGATLIPFLLWTVLVVIVAFFLERHALDLPRGSGERWLFQLLVTACVVLGPLAFAAHLARRLLLPVTVTDDGLLLSRGGVIPYDAILSIEHRAGPFRGGRRLSDSDAFAGVGEGCLWVPVAGEGCLIGLAVIAFLAIGYWILLPVMSLFSPWHARVILHLADGDRVVFRDLDDDDEFVATVRAKMRR